MRGVFLGGIVLAMLHALPAPAVLAARPKADSRTIRDLSGAIPLGILQRSVTAKFYQSLLVSPLEDWSVVRAQIKSRLSGARVIRPAANPAYDALALKYASELSLVANDPRGRAGQTDSAIMHLLIYRIADGVMAVSFAYPESPPGPETRNVGTVRLSLKSKEGRWTEIAPSESRANGGRSLTKLLDRVPIHASSSDPR